MLDFITKRKERKVQLQVETYIDDGLTKLSHKLYKQGMICFSNAIELNAEFVEQKLYVEFKSFYQRGDWDSALSIGLILLQVNKKSYELANRVGNCARKIHNYQQANNLYRLSLRNKKGNREAFYNLAASMGKVRLFDLDVKYVIEKYIAEDKYILPDFVDDPDFIECIKKSLIGGYEDRIRKKIELKKNKSKAQKLAVQEYVPTYKEVLKEIQNRLKKMSDESVSGNKQLLYNMVYNQGLYALASNDFETAFNAFIMIKQTNVKMEYLDMLVSITISHKDKTDRAIDMMIRLLGQDQFNRFLNVNLGLMYRRLGNHLLSTKYLAIGASLLKKSEGFYKISDLMTIAIEHFRNGMNRKALELFKIVVSEKEDERVFSYIGEIYLRVKNYNDAVKTFKDIIGLDPQSELGHAKLNEIHDMFFDKAISSHIDKKFRSAAEYYVKALQVVEKVDTYEKAIETFTQINDLEQAQALQEKLDIIIQREKDHRLEKFRQDYINRGKAFVKQHQFDKAIKNLEQAFRMKVDKDVFMYLAYIYKRLNKTISLTSLMQRWEVMLDMEEKMKQRDREIARAKKSEE